MQASAAGYPGMHRNLMSGPDSRLRAEAICRPAGRHTSHGRKSGVPCSFSGRTAACCCSLAGAGCQEVQSPQAAAWSRVEPPDRIRNLSQPRRRQTRATGGMAVNCSIRQRPYGHGHISMNESLEVPGRAADRDGRRRAGPQGQARLRRARDARRRVPQSPARAAGWHFGQHRAVLSRSPIGAGDPARRLTTEAVCSP
jgi:hypothetical protein